MVGWNCAVTQANACCKSAGEVVAQTKWGRLCDAKSAMRDDRGKECKWKEFEFTQMTQVRRVMSDAEKLASSLWSAATEARETGSTMMMHRMADDWCGSRADDDAI